MCNYCGCREFPLIGQFTVEHEAIANAAGRLRRAITAGEADPGSALDDPISALDDLLALLVPHTATEETGLFAELRAEGSLAEAVERLCAEHDEIHGVLGAVDRSAPDWPTVLIALERLHRHIDNEEHGLFPAAVIALPIDAWDRVSPEVRSRAPRPRAPRTFDPVVATRLGELVDSERHRNFVGRRRELAGFDDAVAGRSAYRVLFVHGPGGIGKTTLLLDFLLTTVC